MVVGMDIEDLNDAEDLGLRERKKRETRLALSRAAIRLCLQNGWDNVTAEDIAEAANVSVRTFRNYFSGKAEAIASSHTARAMRIADDLRARPAGEPLWDSIVDAVVAQFAPEGATTPRDHRWRDALMVLFAEPALQGEILKANAAAQVALAQVVAERTGTDVTRDVYPKLVAAVVGSASAMAVEHCLRVDDPPPLGPLLREVFAEVRAGLPTP